MCTLRRKHPQRVCAEQPLRQSEVGMAFGIGSHLPRGIRAVETQYVP